MGSSTRSAFGDADMQDAGSPEVQQIHEGAQESGAGPRTIELREGYNSEELVRGEIDHSRFAINHLRENKVDARKLSRLATEFSIPRTVGMRVPRDGEKASNPEGTSVAFHPAFLEIGARLPLQQYIRRVLREIGIAPAQLNPNA